MLQVSHPTLRPTGWIRTHRALIAAALATLVAVAAVALVLAIGDDAPSSSADVAPAGLANSGPDESRIAAAVGSAGGGSTTGGPDEAAIAAAVSGR